MIGELDTLKTLTRDFARLAGLPVPLFDADGQAVLPLPDALTLIIAFDEVDAEALLLIPLERSAGAIDATRALSLLEAGYLGQGFGGAAIGLDPVTGALVLWRRLPVAGLTDERLLYYVDLLQRHAVAWYADGQYR